MHYFFLARTADAALARRSCVMVGRNLKTSGFEPKSAAPPHFAVGRLQNPRKTRRTEQRAIAGFGHQSLTQSLKFRPSRGQLQRPHLVLLETVGDEFRQAR